MTEHEQQTGSAAGTPSAGPGGTVNTGLSISGSTVTAGVIAGGQGASVTVNQAGPADDRMARIERLVQQLQAEAGKLDDERAEAVSDDAGRVLSEAKQRKPDSERISQLLRRISVASAPFLSLADIALQLQAAFH